MSPRICSTASHHHRERPAPAHCAWSTILRPATCTTRGRTTATPATRLSYKSGSATMQLRPGVNMTTAGKLAQARDAALSSGAAVFDLVTAGGSTRQAFFDAVGGALPLDPPLV